MPEQPRPLRVLRVIARLNVGGPALHTVILNDGLRRRGVETLLVYGSVGPQEGQLRGAGPCARAAYASCTRAWPAHQRVRRCAGVRRSCWADLAMEAGRRAHAHGQGGHARADRRAGLQCCGAPVAPVRSHSHVSRPRARGVLRASRQRRGACDRAHACADHGSHCHDLCPTEGRHHSTVRDRAGRKGDDRPAWSGARTSPRSGGATGRSADRAHGGIR